MSRSTSKRILAYTTGLALPILTGLLLHYMHLTMRVTGAMVFLLEVLAVAASGQAALAILTSLVAAVTFSYEFFPPAGSLTVNTPEYGIALIAFVITAVTGSQLSLRAQRRADEANRRRDEMQKLQRFSSRMLLCDSVVTAAEAIAREAAADFGFDRVELVLLGDPLSRAGQTFTHGDYRSGEKTVIKLDSEVKAEMRLYGPLLSAEFQSACQTVVGLILDRAAAAENRVRFQSEQRSEELQSTVLNALAHNFRTPLTSIKMASSALLFARDGQSGDAHFAPLTPSQERDLLIAIDEEADRLQALIRESLELAKLEAHRLHPRVEYCKIEDIVTSVFNKLTQYVPPERMEFSLDKDLPPLRGDRVLFEQMLFQVMDNAWKYSSPSARIWVSARVDWTYLILTVQNEGPPVMETERERIFERFVRGSGARTRVEGTGLGLTIARTIAQSYGGKLWLDTEPQGPAFRFALPLETEAQTDRGQGK